MHRENLEKLEDFVTKLWSPQWPESILGKLDNVKIGRGQVLYSKYCIDCHQPIDRKDPDRKVKAQLIPIATIGTDAKFLENALGKFVNTGKLKGRKSRILEGRQLEETEPAAMVLKHAVTGVIAGTISPIECSQSQIAPQRLVDKWTGLLKKRLGNKSAPVTDDNPDPKVRMEALVKRLNVYKARPLNGIWASPPYLHNGSVNSLYELLLPPSQRRSFYLGCNVYDPSRVGLRCNNEDGKFFFDVSLPGNRAMGHDYGPRGENAENERLDLLEYLKSL